ncbi:FGGY-family carbohydrate kinase [Leifsonia poae]|uniref:FGGY-family carbohydrate kinase n=1 Tax=Leifsonia poae TaxID=110933 RepID=UPI001CC1C05C|nr:FGGY family carbohydrate kinase [Leifsonia poae]
MLVYAVDLGTTNLKAVLYDEQLRRLATASTPAVYRREGVRVEFDPESLFDSVIELIGRCARRAGAVGNGEATIVLTGQAESLVLIDRDGEPVRPGMSWLDDRAVAEAVELGDRFGLDEAFAVTGEPFPSATWPAAKLRWLSRYEPEAIASADSILMIKDYIVFRLTGTAVGEVSTRGFTYLWDVPNGGYWHEMIEFCSTPADRLPPVVPAATDLGLVSDEVAALLPPMTTYRVNIGALDHFCAMVGTGSYGGGSVSESAGTVLSLCLLAPDWRFDPKRKVSFHTGLRPGDTVLFNGVDGGGAALEWYRIQGLGGMSYPELEKQLRARDHRNPPMFLPYLTGINPPDYFTQAKGAFLDLDLGHDRVDLAYAVEEGIAHLLRRNVEYFAADPAQELVSTGGGAASAFWNQLKADVCGVDVVVPDELEATCRGAATLALVTAGVLDGFEDASRLNAPPAIRYRPSDDGRRAARYARFDNYLQRLFGDPGAPTENSGTEKKDTR